jgi:hypothetical protein
MDLNKDDKVQLTLNGTVLQEVSDDDTILVHMKDIGTFTTMQGWTKYLDIMNAVVEDLKTVHQCNVIMVPEGTKVEVLKFAKDSK